MGSPGEGSTASSGALQHDSSEFDAELKSSGQVMCVPVGNGLSWYDKADSPTLQTKKAFEGSTGILFLVDTAGFSHSYPVVRSIRRDHALYWTNKLSHGQVFFYKYNFAVYKLSWRAKAQPHVEEAEPAGDASTDLGGSAVLPTSTQRAAQLFLGQKGQITRGQQSHLHVKIPKLNPNFCSKSSKHCC